MEVKTENMVNPETKVKVVYANSGTNCYCVYMYHTQCRMLINGKGLYSRFIKVDLKKILQNCMGRSGDFMNTSDINHAISRIQNFGKRIAQKKIKGKSVGGEIGEIVMYSKGTSENKNNSLDMGMVQDVVIRQNIVNKDSEKKENIANKRDT